MILKNLLTSTAIILSTVLIASCSSGSGGNTTAVVTPPVAVADTVAPSIGFSTADVMLESGNTAPINVNAFDNRGVTTGPIVSCTNGGAVSGTIFTAPVVTEDTIVVCNATAGDAAGNSNTRSLTFKIKAPRLSFTPSAIMAFSGGETEIRLSASDEFDVLTDVTTTCTNGGAFSGTTFTAPAVTVPTDVVCTATAIDSAGNNTVEDLVVTVNPPSTTSTAINGNVTFERVPSNSMTDGLDYDASFFEPVPGLVVILINEDLDEIIDSTLTNSQGDFSFIAPINTNVTIGVAAEMVSPDGTSWNVSVVDNTNEDRVYVVASQVNNTEEDGFTDFARVTSGWDGTSYAGTRNAAPFAILETIHNTIQNVVDVDPDVVFPPLQISWSENNRPAFDDELSQAANIDIGNINSSSYVGNGNILILGAADSDTDEYDEHVIVHEWGHYFEDQLSRSDSIGGPHGQGDFLDPRLAMGEGFGNALAGMMLEDSVYRDSLGGSQALGFSFDVESNANLNEGWFSEGSVQSTLYDLFDSLNDGADTISAGFGPIYDVLTSPAYREHNHFTTIFTFLEQYRLNNAANIGAVNSLAIEQSINGDGATAVGETNNGNISRALPLYKNVTVNGGPTQICTEPLAIADDFNKLGVRVFLAAEINALGSHTFSMVRTSGATQTDPDFSIFKAGQFLGSADSAGVNEEIASDNIIETGLHIFEAYDFDGSEACFNFTITR